MTTNDELTAAPLALVTGASSGSGAAFAQRLAADGYDLIVVGRREERLRALAASLPGTSTEVLVADLATNTGIGTVADVCASRSLTMLVNNAGVAHYMPMAELPADKARELIHVKVVAPAMLTRAALAGMLTREAGTIINVVGMLAFAGPAPAAPPQGQRATYVGTLAATVAMTQTLHTELAGTGVSAHVVCPGIVATEFHEVQGMDPVRSAPHVRHGRRHRRPGRHRPRRGRHRPRPAGQHPPRHHLHRRPGRLRRAEQEPRKRYRNGIV